MVEPEIKPFMTEEEMRLFFREENMESKPFYKSVTFWGTVITTAATFLPKYAPIITEGVGAAGQVIGIVATLVGRFRNGGGAPLTILPAETKQ